MLAYVIHDKDDGNGWMAALARRLAAQGLRVGVYSSPHLLRYNERVRLNGIEASDAQLCEAFAAVSHSP